MQEKNDLNKAVNCKLAVLMGRAGAWRWPNVSVGRAVGTSGRVVGRWHVASTVVLRVTRGEAPPEALAYRLIEITKSIRVATQGRNLHLISLRAD